MICPAEATPSLKFWARKFIPAEFRADLNKIGGIKTNLRITRKGRDIIELSCDLPAKKERDGHSYAYQDDQSANRPPTQPARDARSEIPARYACRSHQQHVHPYDRA